MPATDPRPECRSSTEAPTLGVPWRSPALLAILAATVMTPMDVPLISPALPAIQDAFGVSESAAGLVITLYALPGILLAPVIGALADRIGRRYLLSGCLAMFGLAGTAIAFTETIAAAVPFAVADPFRVALGLRVLQGVAAGSVLSALAMTVVGDRYTGHQHDAVMGVTSATLALGTAAYPLVGGYLAGWSWNAPFLMYALTLPVAGVVFVALADTGSAAEVTEQKPSVDSTDQEPSDDSTDQEQPAGSTVQGYIREVIRAIPVQRAVAVYGVMFLSFGLLFGGVYTALPFYLADAFGFTATAVGLLTTVVLVVTAAVSTQNGRLAGRTSTTVLLAVGFGLYAVGFAGVSLAGGPPTLVGALLVFGVGSGLVTPTLFARLSALAPDHARGGVMSLQTTTIGISQAVGPALFTLGGSTLGYGSTLLGASGGAALVAVLVSVLPLDG